MLRVENPDQHPLLEDRGGVRVSAAESDYNAYCFYVAGTVGHMATELVVVHHGLADDVAAKLAATCEACGRGLQKTNILKDFAKDLGRGFAHPAVHLASRSRFCPTVVGWRAGAVEEKNSIDDVVRVANDATEYVVALPYEAAGYRMASLMSLLPAYQTLLLAAKRHAMLFTTEHYVKIFLGRRWPSANGMRKPC